MATLVIRKFIRMYITQIAVNRFCIYVPHFGIIKAGFKKD